MKIVVLGKPKVWPANSATRQQKTVVTYDPTRQITTVDCDVDIVTLGLAVNVLTEQYESYLASFDAELAEKIRLVTKKAVNVLVNTEPNTCV